MNVVRVLMVLALCGLFGAVAAQCPSTGFSHAAAACSIEAINITNSSAPGTYAWDFCSGDLDLVPTGQSGWSLPGANGRPGIELAYDNKWIGFATGTFSNTLYRMEFDNGLQAAPTTIQNLGNLGGTVSQPGQIRIIKEAGQWFGLLHNTGGDLLKLSFGAQLTNTPAVTTLISGIVGLNAGLSVGRDDVHGYVCVLSLASDKFAIIRLGLSLSMPNPVSDVITSATVTNPNALGDIDLINVCGNWYGLADNLGNGNIYRLDFGSSLFSTPLITELGNVTGNPGRIRWVKEGDDYYFLVLGLDGALTKGSFGASVTSIPSGIVEGNLGGVLPLNMYGLTVAKENSVWTILGLNQANGQVFRINYADNCSATPKSSSLTNPTVVYATAGAYKVSLENTSGSIIGSHEASITISALQAPDIDFTSLNQCSGSNVQFTSVNTSGNIVNYNWGFGDTQGSALANPPHVYAAAGSFMPGLVVTASNGCMNTVLHPLTIYNQPVADFSLPLVAPVCTNQPYLYTNTSTYDPPSNPTWEWRVNGVLISSQPDLTTSFNSAVSQEIRLKSIIPGCENEVIKNISTVLPGPVIGFSVTDDCVSNVVPFTNASTGVDAGYDWDFGDGSQSTTPSPNHQYLTPGTYTVTLTGSNIAGCQNVTSLPVKIYSVPQPDFFVGLPPFSCSGTATPFQNNTPPLTDSNLLGWVWSFGDPGSGTSTSYQPAFTYTGGGNYSVQLTATSDVGCSNSVTKLIGIGTSPVADFVFGPACFGQPTLFTDNSSGGVQSWTWQMDGDLYTTASPSHTFSGSGNHTVTLTVGTSSGCTNLRSKLINVPSFPSLTISKAYTCAGQTTYFALHDFTSAPFDPILDWEWNIAGTQTTGSPGATRVFSIPGIFPFSVTTTHASGCVFTKSDFVTINESPVAGFTATPDRGEAPLTVQFQNTSTGTSQYLWTFGGSTPGSSTALSPTYTFLDLGDHTVQLTATLANGCSDTEIMPIQVLVAAIDLEVLDFSLSPDPVTGKLRASITVRNNSNVPVNAVEAALHLSSVAIVNENITVNLDPGESITRTLSFTFSPDQLTDRYVCAELISEKDIQADNNRKCLSLDEGDFILPPYPNPSSGTLRVDWVSATSGTARLAIYNSQGRREYEWETLFAAGLNQSEHDLNFLAPGVYLMTVQTPDAQRTLRFVRQ